MKSENIEDIMKMKNKKIMKICETKSLVDQNVSQFDSFSSNESLH